ncbi:hypothetical protein [Lentibacillus salicampi]|uniref:hypothetical protein n=1 Tax=Lentibacillus salicampi TaxID=175306 RepID=UPI0014300A6F|nr:hypothetical protein [Lentibacillus salicampi]
MERKYDQQAYNKKWADKNKEHKRYLSYKSTTKTFIKNYANPDDLEELKKIIKEFQ